MIHIDKFKKKLVKFNIIALKNIEGKFYMTCDIFLAGFIQNCSTWVVRLVFINNPLL